MELTIDTTNNQQVKVALDNDQLVARAGPETPQQVINLVDELLTKHQVGMAEIKTIKVETGPGSFTGLRVGITIANVLGWALGVPVNGQRISPRAIITPRYQ